MALSDIAIASATARVARIPLGAAGSVCCVRTTNHPSTPPLTVISVESTTGIETIGWVSRVPEGVDPSADPLVVLAETCDRYGDPLELRSGETLVAEGRLLRDVSFPGPLELARDLTRPDSGSKGCVIRGPAGNGNDTLITLLFYLRTEELARDLAST